MQKKDFDYYLPKELIATKPSNERGDSRMLVWQNAITDSNFVHLVEYLPDNSLVVFNETKVQKARLKASFNGLAVELLAEVTGPNTAKCMLKLGKAKLNTGDILTIKDFKITITGKRDRFFLLESEGLFNEIIEKEGILPLPPYFNREADTIDETRYQTIFAKDGNSIAAPTASLHFTKDTFKALKEKNIKCVYLNLDVGFGTFLPVQTENINEHKMHSERYTMSNETAKALNAHVAKKHPIIAIGTTVVRSLEHNFTNKFNPGVFYADNFIYPGVKFKIVKGILTNFHLPKSTLLMLVAAFVGYENMQKIYAHGVHKRYRFFSYGDCMLLLP